MRIHCLTFLCVFAFTLYSQAALAFLDPPYITPANPRAADMISVNMYAGDCDAIVGLQGYPQITQQGKAIRVLFFSVHYDDPEFCNLGVGTATTSIGSYPAGSYTLQVERRYMTVFGSWVQETLGVIPFTVSGVPAQHPIEAIALNVTGYVTLLLALIAAALFVLRSRNAPV